MDGSLRIGATGSHVPHKSLKQGHAAFMPDAIWAVDRYLPDFSRANETPPVLTPSMHFSTRLQRFARARLLASHLTESSPAFSSTLTTIALYDSSSRWFETHSCKPVSRGHPLISCAAQLQWKCLNHSSSFAPSWRTLIEMPLRCWPRASTVRFSGEHRPELQDPSPHRFVGDIQSALREQILDVAITERETHIKPNGVPDSCGRKVVASKRDRHAPSYPPTGWALPFA